MRVLLLPCPHSRHSSLSISTPPTVPIKNESNKLVSDQSADSVAPIGDVKMVAACRLAVELFRSRWIPESKSHRSIMSTVWRNPTATITTRHHMDILVALTANPTPSHRSSGMLSGTVDGKTFSPCAAHCQKPADRPSCPAIAEYHYVTLDRE